MWTRHRLMDFGVLFFLAALLVGPPIVCTATADDIPRAEAKPGPNDPKRNDNKANNPVETPRVPSQKEEGARRKLEAAADYIADGDWVVATNVLQDLLELSEDFLVPVVRQKAGKQTVVRVSLKGETERLLASLPQAGRQFYELKYGSAAAEMLKTARKEKDKAMLQRLVSSYLYTAAGSEAVQDLAAHYFADKNYDFAARCYEMLLRHRGLARWTPEQLFQATVAFRLNGEADNAAVVSRELFARGAVQLGDRRLTPDDIRKELDKLPKPGQVAEWKMVGGNATRNAQGIGGAPFLVQVWNMPLARATETAMWLKQAETILAQRGQPVLPGMVPLMTTTTDRDMKPRTLILFHSYWGVHAVDMHTGKLVWETPSSVSMDRMVRDAKKTGTITQWVGQYLNTAPQWLFENTLVGTSSSDDQRVYLVEDFPLLPNVAAHDKDTPRFAEAEIAAALRANRLQAYTLKDGKLRWILSGPEEAKLGEGFFLGAPLPLDGKLYAVFESELEPPKCSNALLLACPELLFAGPKSPAAAPQPRDTREAPLPNKIPTPASGFVTGIWTPASGYIWPKASETVVAEPRDLRELRLRMQGVEDIVTSAIRQANDTREVRLVTLDPATGKVLAVRTLFTHAREAQSARRMQAVHLAAGNGVLVCCAHTGTIVAYDVLTQRLLWSHTYNESPGVGGADVWNPRAGGRPPPGFVPGPDSRWYNPEAQVQWKTTAPIIAEGKVLVAACDSAQLLCLNLRDGSLVWSAKREADDLYLAGVVHGKALVVGKGYARAFSLTDGKQLWRVETGMPSGYGAFCEDRYYLPLKEATAKKQPAICVLDMDKGAVASYITPRNKEVPGNLVFAGDQVISQNGREIVGYPQLAARLKMIDEALAKNPNDPEGLYSRAVMRLDKGDVMAAIEDLRKALQNKPSEDLKHVAREKLHDALTDLVQRDFDKAEMYLKEYADLCEMSAATDPSAKNLKPEQRQRRASYLLLVGKGREKQGRLADAMRLFLDLAAMNPDGLMPLLDDPDLKVDPQVWVGSRIEQMLKNATPEQRKEIEEELLKRLKKTKT